MDTLKITITTPIERIADLLSHAFESGDVGYWCRLGKVHGLTKRNRERAGYLAKRHDSAVWLPLAGGSVEIIEHNDSKDPKDWSEPRLLNWTAIKRGLALMADPKNEHAHHFGDWLKESDDMTTGDVFLQFCVLGEVMYG
ncbi:MAG: hypothetical protein KGK07_14760 [Chloroflexota bacterium]|nr:hypothetical protein [Chloroflexota bacterium]